MIVPMNLAKPTQAFNRFQYQTGDQGGAAGPAGSRLTSTDYEQSSLVSQIGCFVTSIELAVAETAVSDLYLLAWDVPGNDANLQLALGGQLAGARQTFGPIPPGGTMVREFGEMFPGVQSPLYVGSPFDFGVLLLASLTPRVFTAPGAVDAYCVTVRGTTKEGC